MHEKDSSNSAAVADPEALAGARGTARPKGPKLEL